MRTMTAARLATAQATATAGTARIWAADPSTGKRRDLTGEEDRAFWTWAAVETLRHTGIRIEELTELSHHSLIQYTLPGTGEPVPLLQIAPSKTDTERLLVISPELADVLAAVISRIRGRDGALGCVASYDSHERVWNPPMPLLFQRRFGIEHRAIPADTIRGWIGHGAGAAVTDAAGQPLRFTPHDFRRMFITDAVLHGMPPHIAQLVAGHRDINTTMGYKAVYPDEVINGHRAFITRRRALRPSAEYRVPTEQEWDEFLGHFEHRKLSLGTCGRSYATPCIHEHACLRCSLLRPDPAQRPRLVEIRNNLHARIAEARREGWLGEVDGLQISLTGARQKLDQLDRTRPGQPAPTSGCPASRRSPDAPAAPTHRKDHDLVQRTLECWGRSFLLRVRRDQGGIQVNDHRGRGGHVVVGGVHPRHGPHPRTASMLPTGDFNGTPNRSRMRLRPLPSRFLCLDPGLMEALIPREDEGHGSTTEVPGGASGAGDPVGGGRPA